MSDEFDHLIDETLVAFSGGWHGKTKFSWDSAIKNVLRRLHFYQNILEESPFDHNSAFNKYCAAFDNKKTSVTYLVPIEFVRFTQDQMDFGYFQIRRFSEKELGSIIDNSVNEIFYQYAVADLPLLKNYWFIYVKEAKDAPKIGYFRINLSDYGSVKQRYTGLPIAIEPIIRQLVLYDWQADHLREDSQNQKQKKENDKERGWASFNVPITIRINDCLYETPSSRISVSKLRTEPLFDARTGEEYGERPVVYFKFNEQETEAFREYMKRICDIFEKLDFENEYLKYMDIALGMLTKAFFAEGIEQLLWHITSIEAVLGERGEDLSEKIARRIATIMGKNKKATKKRFKELYNFRSALVHGNKFGDKVYWGHLREAREFARISLAWFLNFLAAIHYGISNSQLDTQFPKRKIILNLLDMDEKERSQLKSLAQILPPGFPHKDEWLV